MNSLFPISGNMYSMETMQSRRLTEIKSVPYPIQKNILFDILLLMDFGRAARTRLFKLINM